MLSVGRYTLKTLVCNKYKIFLDLQRPNFCYAGPILNAFDYWNEKQLILLSGQTVYTCMLNHKGFAEADLTVSVLESGSGGPHAPKFEGKSKCCNIS